MLYETHAGPFIVVGDIIWVSKSDEALTKKIKHKSCSGYTRIDYEQIDLFKCEHGAA